MNNQDENKGFKPSGIVKVCDEVISDEQIEEAKEAIKKALPLYECDADGNFRLIKCEGCADKDKVIKALWLVVNSGCEFCSSCVESTMCKMIRDCHTVEQFTEKFLGGKE